MLLNNVNNLKQVFYPFLIDNNENKLLQNKFQLHISSITSKLLTSKTSERPKS